MRISWLNNPKAVEILTLLLIFSLTWFSRSELIFGSPTPQGYDAGNMLAFAHALVGNNVKPNEVSYPPIIPALLAGLNFFLDDLSALKVLASALSILNGIPFYLLTRRITDPWAALPATLIFLSSEVNTNTLAWSGYPQLLGLAMLLFALYFLNQSLAEPKKLNVILAALLMSLTFGTSHFVFIVYIGILFFYVIWLVTLEYSNIKRWFKTLGMIVILFIIFSLPYFKIYMVMLSGMAQITTNMHGIPNSNLLVYFLNTFQFIFGTVGFPIFWYLLFYLAIITTFFSFFRHHEKRNTLFYCATFWSPLLLHLWFQEIRFLSFALIGMSISFAMLIEQVRNFVENLKLTRITNGEVSIEPHLKFRRLLFVLIGIEILTVSIAAFYSSQNKYGEAFDYYHSFDNEAKDAMDWLRLNTQKDSIVATPRWTVGWWIEGYAQRRTIWGGPSSWLTFSIERKNAEIANLIFQKAIDTQPLKTLLKENNITYIVLDKSLKDYGIPNVEEKGNIGNKFLAPAQDFHIVFENLRFTIIDVREAIETAYLIN